MVSFTEFDPLEVAEIQSIAAQIGGVGGRAGDVRGGGTPSQIDAKISRQTHAERDKIHQRQLAANRKEKKQTSISQAFLDRGVKPSVGTNLTKAGTLLRTSLEGVAIGAAIRLVPPAAFGIAGAAARGAAVAGLPGAAVAVAGAAAVFIVGEIARRNEEQQEAIRRARGIETLAARKRRLPIRIFLDPIDNAAQIIERTQLFIKEHVKAPLAGVARRFEVAPGLEAAYDGLRVLLAPLNTLTDNKITNALGIAVHLDAQSILPDIPIERFHREKDIAKWQSLPINSHPVAGFIMNEMRRRIDSQIAGTGVAGGWKVEPVSGD